MERHPYKIEDSNREPKGVHGSQIFANIKMVVTRFGVVEDRVEVDMQRIEDDLGGSRYLRQPAREFGGN